MYTLENGASFETLEAFLHYVRTKRDSGIDMSAVEALLNSEIEKEMNDAS